MIPAVNGKTPVGTRVDSHFPHMTIVELLGMFGPPDSGTEKRYVPDGYHEA